MFIFSSNSARYVFDYKLSKPYRVNYTESVIISPSILTLSKETAKGEAITIGHNIGGFSVELRDLLIAYLHSDPVVINHNIGGFSVELRDLLIAYRPDENAPDLINGSLGNISGTLYNALITHTAETDVIHGSIENITGVLENV